MSHSFKALNIESDDESDVEIDDTKEIQIEEALKLYAIALRHHAAGPASFDQAAVAYEQLFASDIFKYLESQTELARIELYGHTAEVEEVWNDDITGNTVVPSSGLDTIPSTLPQILHLSHKNYAQFKLEYLNVRLDSLNTTLATIIADATAALDHFVQALDKDDGDLDLWRKSAAVGEILNSKRIARFCLESVLDGDDEGLNAALLHPGLLESLANEHLRALVAELHDTLSILQQPLSRGRRKLFSKALKASLDSHDTIKLRRMALEGCPTVPGLLRPPVRVWLKSPTTWADMAESILQQSTAEHNGAATKAPSSAISFEGRVSLEPEETKQLDPSPAADVMEVVIQPTLDLPTAVHDQFPGLDGGEPTVQPRLSPADPSMNLILLKRTSVNEDVAMESASISLPSRKRSGDTAGLGNGTEEGRHKVRRTRARESTADAGDSRQALLDANMRWEYMKKIEELEKVDEWMFGTAERLFERIGISTLFDAGKHVRQEVGITSDELVTAANQPPPTFESLRSARLELLEFLSGYDEQLAQMLLNGGESLDVTPGITGSGSGGGFGTQTRSTSTTKATPMTNDGIDDVVNTVNRGWYLTEDVVWTWVTHLLEPGHSYPEANTYTQCTWPEALKTMVVRMLVNFDDCIFTRARQSLEDVTSGTNANAPALDITRRLAETIQTIFEIHLDIFTLIKQPNSGVDVDTVTGQGDRLQRWAELAREAIHFRTLADVTRKLDDQLTLRFFWATTFHVSVDASVTQEHTLACMKDLSEIFAEAGNPTIILQNNAIMPELSIAALEKEKSRLTTKDFFLKVTSPELGDPVALIESLEPLLNLLATHSTERNQSQENVAMIDAELPVDCSPELVRFLLNSEVPVRLLLWQRLRDAYLAIDYKPMVVLCYFRVLQLCLHELKSDTFKAMAQQDRQITVLKRLRFMQTAVAKLHALIQTADDPLECLDEPALVSAVGTLAELLQILQVFNIFEDPIRLGQTASPSSPSGLPLQSFVNVSAAMHDSQIRAWIVLYHLLKDAISQNANAFPMPTEDRFEFLRSIHRNLGIRGFCGSSNRALVRMLRDEFRYMTHIEGYEEEQSQVLYDLYGINCFVDPAHDLMEHNCTHDAFVDRSAAMQAVDLLLVQAAKLPIKELIKHSLKDTIDKVHGTVVRKKPSDDILRNREVYRAFLKSPIRPQDLFDCLKGSGNGLPIARIPKEDAMLAAKGWYFLMGHMSLTKFRAQKRNAPAPTEDLDIAIAFFNQDLEYSMDNWETWFRLAQAYDTKIEENVVWSAEKLNNNMPEVIQLQRTAIHCYTMATALANRSADLAFETADKMTDLYAEFASRLYSSSREPFAMLPFALEDDDRFLSTSRGVEKAKSFTPLRVYTAWKLAKVMYQRALMGRDQLWTLHYELGKCLWKMHSATEDVRRNDTPPPASQVLECFVRAIELLPEKKDSREKREPILEPHYKLLSVVHKLVQRQGLSLEQAEEVMRHTPFSRTVRFPDEMEEWLDYVLGVLKHLKAADKSNWYHRIIVRSAEIVYHDPDQAELPLVRAKVAKNELTQQLFTKTMVLQVWRPEAERAGRHFVYYARYTRFFVKILEELNDRTNLEMLARRVRRRVHDVFEHSLVWQDICSAYLRLLRGHARIADGLETSTFNNIAHEDFLARKAPLEKWMQARDSAESPTLDVLREVQELKKTNSGLMKPGPIDDLIGDAYAKLFDSVGRQLWDEEQRLKNDDEVKRAAPVASPPRNPMMSLTHLMNVDGSSSAVPAAKPTTNPPAPSAATPVPDALPARKKVGVGRREIRTCAESCFQRAAAVEVKDTARRQAGGTRVQVVIEDSRNGPGDVSVDTSAPGSVHDSADESELSELGSDGEEEAEVEREEAARIMFPGLAASIAASSAAIKLASENALGNDEAVSESKDDVEMEDTAQSATPADVEGEEREEM